MVDAVKLHNQKWFQEYLGKRESYDKDDSKKFNWQCFVKLARTYNITPKEPDVFKGRLHNPFTTAETDSCNKPQMDGDKNFIQFCFKDPEDLGEDRLFIEFDVEWNEWLDDYKQKKKDGKTSDKEMQKTIKDHVEENVNSYDQNK